MWESATIFEYFIFKLSLKFIVHFLSHSNTLQFTIDTFNFPVMFSQCKTFDKII